MGLFLTIKGKQKRIKEVESKYHYYHSLLIGECLQILQRIEVISHSNLVYSQYYTENFRKYLDIINKEAKSCEKAIGVLDDHILDPKKANFKEDFKRANILLEDFKMKVNSLNETLLEIIQPEEDARGRALVVKEYAAYVKKKYYQNNSNFELANQSFEKIFAAVEKKFNIFDKHIDSAEYDLALALLPKIKKVLEELNKITEVLPKICLDANNNIPSLIEQAYSLYDTLDNKKLPLFFLNPKKTLRLFKEENNTIIELIRALKADEAARRIKTLEASIIDFINALQKEDESKAFYDVNFNKIYDFADSLGKKIINIYNEIPNIRKIYKFDEPHDNILEQLQNISSKLTEAKRNVDVNIFTTSRQPYSLIIEKIKALHEVNEEIANFLNSFNAYIKSLKDDSANAFNLVSKEYSVLRAQYVVYESLHLQNNEFKDNFEYLYLILDSMVEIIKTKPVDVISLNKKLNEYKNLSSELYKNVNSRNEKKIQCEKYIEILNGIRSDFENVDINMSVAEELYAKSQYNESLLILDKIYKENISLQKNDLFR